MAGGRHWSRWAAILAVVVIAAALVVTHRSRDRGASPLPSGTTSPAAATSPFTGLPQRAPAPVLAVKIDNVAAARPHTGLTKADLVYVEEVESGLSRILAVFSSHLPPRVGPVRSARESDLELLRQFGRPALAYSGAQSKLLPVIAGAAVDDVSPAHAPQAYTRDSARQAPHNLYAAPAELLAAAPSASTSHDIGFRFGPSPASGTPTTDKTVRFPSARVAFHWSAGQSRWLVSFDGRPETATEGGQLGPPTVVIQYVTVRASGYHDRWGNSSPYSETVGSGRAVVLRDGRAYDGTWSRPSAAGGTTFTTTDGRPLNFAKGQVWVVLAPKSG
ncbi:MAG: hypothetical protein QOF44_196 [Streptomyces sp.]|nr:hypothetical protein [Streptomyces sp.]